jgi:hypothetical protein
MADRRLSGVKALGHVFFVKISGGIAVPPLDLAKAMTRGTAGGHLGAATSLRGDGGVQGIDLSEPD